MITRLWRCSGTSGSKRYRASRGCGSLLGWSGNSSGQVYFGKLEGLGTAFPVLREVFYVQSRQDPQTKAVSNILVKRGKEWHAPDRMILNSNMIVLVEPVNPSSRVAQLIAEAQ